MKKKGILVFGMVILCSLLVYIAGGWQSRMYSKINAGTESASPVTESAKDTIVEDKTVTEQEVKPVESSTPAPSNTNADSSAGAGSTASSGNSTNNNTSTTTKNNNGGTPQATPKPQKPNLIITDRINNKTILSVKAAFGGKNVYDITTSELTKAGIAYKSNVAKDYIRSIAGLTEKSPDPASGWIFYVNGKKSGIGAKAYIPKDGDTIEWKFLKDAISN